MLGSVCDSVQNMQDQEVLLTAEGSGNDTAEGGLVLGNFETGASFDVVGKSFKVSLRFKPHELRTDSVLLWFGQHKAGQGYQEGRDRYLQIYGDGRGQLHWTDGSGGNFPRGKIPELDTSMYHTVTYELNREGDFGMSILTLDGAEIESKEVDSATMAGIETAGTLKMGHAYNYGYKATLAWLRFSIDGEVVASYDFWKGHLLYREVVPFGIDCWEADILDGDFEVRE